MSDLPEVDDVPGFGLPWESETARLQWERAVGAAVAGGVRFTYDQADDPADTVEVLPGQTWLQQPPAIIPTPWAPGVRVGKAAVRRPTVSNLHAYVTVDGNEGLTGDTEPDPWPTDGSSVVDGDVEWRDIGLIGSPSIVQHVIPGGCNEWIRRDDDTWVPIGVGPDMGLADVALQTLIGRYSDTKQISAISQIEGDVPSVYQECYDRNGYRTAYFECRGIPAADDGFPSFSALITDPFFNAGQGDQARIEIFPQGGGGGPFALRLWVRTLDNADFVRITFDANGMTVEGLPTVDPAVAGRAWLDSGVFTVSTGP